MKNFSVFLTSIVISVSALADVAMTGKPDAEVLAKHIAIMGADECQSDLVEQSETYKLNNDTSLVLIPCYMGAYQGSSRAYIVKGVAANKYIEQVVVLTYNESATGVTGTLDLTSAAYDPATKALYTHAKGRGIGDCGNSTVSKVIVDEYSVSVKTVEIRAKVKCDGKLTAWPVVFKQK